MLCPWALGVCDWSAERPPSSAAPQKRALAPPSSCSLHAFQGTCRRQQGAFRATSEAYPPRGYILNPFVTLNIIESGGREISLRPGSDPGSHRCRSQDDNGWNEHYILSRVTQQGIGNRTTHNGRSGTSPAQFGDPTRLEHSPHLKGC